MSIELLKSARNYVEAMAGKSVFAANLLKEIDEYLAKPLPGPVAWMRTKKNGEREFYSRYIDDNSFVPVYAEPQYTRERAEEKQLTEPVKLLFPTMLRKMWSGGEVQAWLDKQPPLYAEPPAGKPLTDEEIEEFCFMMPEQLKDVFKMGVRFAEDRIHGIRDYINGPMVNGIKGQE